MKKHNKIKLFLITQAILCLMLILPILATIVSLGVEHAKADTKVGLTVPPSGAVGVGKSVAITVTFQPELFNSMYDNSQSGFARLMVLTQQQHSDGVDTDPGVESVSKKGWTLTSGGPSFSETVTWDTSGTVAGTHWVILKVFADVPDLDNADTFHPTIASAESSITLASAGTTGGTGDTGGGATVSDDARKTAAGTVNLNPLRFNKVTSISSLFIIIISLLRYAIWTAALIGIIYGGVTMMQAAADPNKVATGKKFIIYSVVGLILAIFTQVIINATISMFAK